MSPTGKRAPAISIRGAGKKYSGVTVLTGVDLDIAPGEVHSLVG
jgi:ABC-type sugar transport system ATPase subunit